MGQVSVGKRAKTEKSKLDHLERYLLRFLGVILGLCSVSPITLAVPPFKATSSDVVEAYIVQPGDTLSELLYVRGLRIQLGYRLYGPGGYVEIHTKLNPQISDWRTVRPGDKLYIMIPGSLKKGPAAVWIPPAPPPEARVENAPSILKEIPVPPVTSPDNIAPEVLSDVTTEPKRKRLTKPIKFSNGRHKVSSTYAYPLVDNAIVLSQLRLFTVRATLSRGRLAGLQLGLDYVGKATDTFENESFDLGWRRLSLGWHFAFVLPWQLGIASLTPSVAHMQLEAHLPVEVAAGGFTRRGFVINKKPSVAYEFGFERRLYSHPDIRARVIFGRDVSVSPLGVGKGEASVSTYRFGGEGELGIWRTRRSRLQLALVGFFLHESMLLSGGTSEVIASLSPTGTASEAGLEQIFIDINYAGGGMSLRW